MLKTRFLGYMLTVLICSIFITGISISSVSGDTFKVGSYGKEVRELQLQLEKFGYFKGNSNGVFGLMTESSVKDFQEKNFYEVTGQVDENIYVEIMSLEAKTEEVSDGEEVEHHNIDVITHRELKTAQLILKSYGYYLGQIDGIYGPKTAAAIIKFQTSYGFESNGEINLEVYENIVKVGNKKSKEVIISRDSNNRRQNVIEKKDNIELLNWWTEANEVFYVSGIAKVYDVRTGECFSIVRTYGSNHADCEALTTEDSDTIKEIWGGSWSWARRPVIIEISGRKLAASMAAMPHAGLEAQAEGAYVRNRSKGYGTGYNLDMIKKNGMDGHIDVHFLNSRTHGSNKVNKDHQDAVMEAYKSK